MPTINNFAGYKPRISDRLLANNEATKAVNLYQSGGQMVAFKEPLQEGDDLTQSVGTLFRIKNSPNLLCSVDDRSYAESPSIDSNQTFWTDNTQASGLKVSNVVSDNNNCYDEAGDTVHIEKPDLGNLAIGRVNSNRSYNFSLRDRVVIGNKVYYYATFASRSQFAYFLGIHIYNLIGRNIQETHSGILQDRQATNTGIYLSRIFAIYGTTLYYEYSEIELRAARLDTTIARNAYYPRIAGKDISIPSSIRFTGIEKLLVIGDYLYYCTNTKANAFDLRQTPPRLNAAKTITFRNLANTSNQSISIQSTRVFHDNGTLYLATGTSGNAIHKYDTSTKLRLPNENIIFNYPQKVFYDNDYFYDINGKAYSTRLTRDNPLEATNPKTSLASTNTNHIDPNNPRTYDDITNFVVTYQNTYGFESQPSPSSNLLYYNNKDPITITGIPYSNDSLVSTVKIYAEYNGEYLYLSQISNVGGTGSRTTTLSTKINNSELSEPLKTQKYANPPTNPKDLTALPNGIFALSNNDSVYLSEPYQPHAYPLEYIHKIPYIVVGLASVSNGLLVLTQGSPYLITGSTPSVMTAQAVNSNQSCMSRRSIVVQEGICYYSSPDGIVQSSSGRVLTRDIFTRNQWQELNPSSMQLSFHEESIIVSYQKPNEDRKLKVIDIRTNTVTDYQDLASNGNIVGIYYDIKDDITYYSTDNNKLLRFNDGDSKLPVSWTCKTFTRVEGYIISTMRVDASAYPLTVKFITGELTPKEYIVRDNKPFRIGDGTARTITYCFEISTEVTENGVTTTTNSEIYNISYANKAEEIA